jgi:hypothetical protein
MEFENARAPGALRANEEAPRAAVAKFAMHDAYFASEHALAFAETDDYPLCVGGYRPTCAQPRDALTCREVVVKIPVLTHRSYVAPRGAQFLLGVIAGPEHLMRTTTDVASAVVAPLARNLEALTSSRPS